MVKARFVCKNCGYEFEVEIFEEGEAEEKRLSSSPVRCKKCGGSAERI